MDVAVALWILAPLAGVHLLARRKRALLLFQVMLDVALVLLPGRVLLRGLHVGPGVPGATEWGAPAAVTGSPEQSDLPLEFSVWWAEVRRLGAAGVPPWISDRIGGGVPLFANGQTGLPFPLQLPVWVLGPERGSDVMAVWKLEIAALGGFLLLRRLSCRPAAATAGALAFGLGLYPLSWLVVPLAWVVAATPWTWRALIGTLRGDRRDGVILAVLLGILAGWSVHPESATFLWLAVAGGGAVLAWGRRRRAARLLVPLALAVPVAAVGALPTLLTIADSAKLAASADAVYPDPDVDWALRARMAALVLAPWRDGDPASGTWRLPFPHAAVAVGVGGVVLALIGAAPLRRRHTRNALALATVGGAAAALVFQLPAVSWLASRVPVLGVMTWTRAGFLVSFALAGVAALAADSWQRNPRRARLAVVAGVTALAAALLRLSVPQRLRGADAVSAPLPALLATASLSPTLAPVVFPTLVALQALSEGWEILPGSRSAGRGRAIIGTLEERVGREGGRVMATGAALPANLPARLGLADLRSLDPVRSRPLARLHRALGVRGMDLPGPVTSPWAGLAGAWNVHWLVTPAGGIEGPCATGWVEVYRDDLGRLYRNARVLPVLRLASRVAVPPGDPGAGAWEGVDFAATAVTDATPVLGGTGTILLVEDRAASYAARVRARGAVLAVLHVPRAPGWRVDLDGRPAPILEADLAAMAVVVPGGEHEVRWRYHPPGLVVGVALTIAGLAGCVVYLLRSGRRRR